MNWFDGNFAKASQQSKIQNAILLVFIEGRGLAESDKLEKFLDNDRITAKLIPKHFLSVKVRGDDLDYLNFLKIYLLVPVPSIFFLAVNGEPLHICTSLLASVDELSLAIDKTLLLSGKCKAFVNLPEASTSAACRANTGANPKTSIKAGTSGAKSSSSTSVNTDIRKTLSTLLAQVPDNTKSADAKPLEVSLGKDKSVAATPADNQDVHPKPVATITDAAKCSQEAPINAQDPNLKQDETQPHDEQSLKVGPGDEEILVVTPVADPEPADEKPSVGTAGATIKSNDAKPSETKTLEQSVAVGASNGENTVGTPIAKKDADPKPVVAKPADEKASVATPCTTISADIKADDGKPSETKSLDEKYIKVGPRNGAIAVGTPTDKKDADPKPVVAKPADAKASAAAPGSALKPDDAKPSGTKPLDEQSLEVGPGNGENAVGTPIAKKDADPKPVIAKAIDKPSIGTPGTTNGVAIKPDDSKPETKLDEKSVKVGPRTGEIAVGTPTNKKDVAPEQAGAKPADKPSGATPDTTNVDVNPSTSKRVGLNFGGPKDEADVTKNDSEISFSQKDLELKELKEKLRRDRLEDQAARERVLTQIAADRAERARRFEAPLPVATQNTANLPEKRENSTAGDMTRLQFRFAHGDNKAHNFKRDETLGVVRAYVREELMASSGAKEFSLATSYPRREFTPEDEERSLIELELSPTAVILVIEKSGSGPGAIISRSGIVNMITLVFWTILSPFVTALDYIKNFYNGRGGDDHTLGGSARHTPIERSNRPTSDADNSRNAFADNSEQKRYRHYSGANIHRLGDNQTDSEDENATWNGNSTQQQ